MKSLNQYITESNVVNEANGNKKYCIISEGWGR